MGRGRPFRVIWNDGNEQGMTTASDLRHAEVKMGNLVMAGMTEVHTVWYGGDGATYRMWAVADTLGWAPLVERSMFGSPGWEPTNQLGRAAV